MRNTIRVFLLSIIALSITSCTKEPSEYYNQILGGDQEFVFDSPSQGDDKKVDIKGSLMNGDMKHPNIEAWLSGSTLYVRFNQTVENCTLLVSTDEGRVVYSRQVDSQYPGTFRVFMGNKPSGYYQLYISNGHQSAEGRFFLNGERKTER